MTQKTVLAVLVTGIVTLAAGLGLGAYVGRVDREEAMSRYELVEARKLADAEARLAAAAADLEKARAAREQLAEEKEALEGQVKGLDEELQGEREKSAVASPEKGELPIAFGQHAELEGLTNADWPTMGKAILAMNGLFKELLERVERGEPVGPELQKKIQEENAKLVQLAAGVMGKIPTHSQINGEFSHPAVLTNLLNAVLEESGAPLTDKQRAAIARLGAEYEAAYEGKQKGYGDGTPQLEKLVDELELKHACMSKVHGALTPEQEEAAYDPQFRDRMQLDVLSPGVSTILTAQLKQYASAEEARTKFQQAVLKDLGIDASAEADLGPAFDAWQREVASLLEPQADIKAPPWFSTPRCSPPGPGEPIPPPARDAGRRRARPGGDPRHGVVDDARGRGEEGRVGGPQSGELTRRRDRIQAAPCPSPAYGQESNRLHSRVSFVGVIAAPGKGCGGGEPPAKRKKSVNTASAMSTLPSVISIGSINAGWSSALEEKKIKGRQDIRRDRRRSPLLSPLPLESPRWKLSGVPRN